MNTYIAVAVVLVLAAAAGLALYLRRSPTATLLDQRLRERFVVTLVTGETFNGLLMEADERTVILRDAQVLASDGKVAPVDGELLLRREAIAYLQHP